MYNHLMNAQNKIRVSVVPPQEAEEAARTKARQEIIKRRNLEIAAEFNAEWIIKGIATASAVLPRTPRDRLENITKLIINAQHAANAAIEYASEAERAATSGDLNNIYAAIPVVADIARQTAAAAEAAAAFTASVVAVVDARIGKPTEITKDTRLAIHKTEQSAIKARNSATRLDNSFTLSVPEILSSITVAADNAGSASRRAANLIALAGGSASLAGAEWVQSVL